MPGSEEFDAEIDLLQRYEQMIQTQIETLNGIDDEAAYVARLVGILAGLVLTSLSILASADGFVMKPTNGVAIVLATSAITALVISLVYAIVTYLSSEFEYGPSAQFGPYVATNQVPEREYKDLLLQGYSSAIRANRRVVVANAKRFERCLASVTSGVLLLFGLGIVIVTPDRLWIDAIVAATSLTLVILFVRHVLREEYLTLDRQVTSNE